MQICFSSKFNFEEDVDFGNDEENERKTWKESKLLTNLRRFSEFVKSTFHNSFRKKKFICKREKQTLSDEMALKLPSANI